MDKKEAMKILKDFHDKSALFSVRTALETVFPEFLESKDERIRQQLLYMVKEEKEEMNNHLGVRGMSYDDMITWLEKQGEEKSTDISIKEKAHQIAWETSKHYDPLLSKESWCEMAALDMAYWLEKQGGQNYESQGIVESRPTKEGTLEKLPDGIEFPFKAKVKKNNKIVVIIRGQLDDSQPKDSRSYIAYSSDITDGYKVYKPEELEFIKQPGFKVGNWVVNKLGEVWHIDSFYGKNYQVSDGKGNYNYFPISKQDEMRLWTIEYAKKSDILCYNDEVFIYKHDIKNCTKKETSFGGIVYYCCYDGKRFITDSMYSLTEKDKDKIHPSTKEQKELLFQKMKEAGYSWNGELKKNTKFSKGDWIYRGTGDPYFVESVFEEQYELCSGFGYHFNKGISEVDSDYRLWNINDASFGDILADDNTIAIYEEQSTKTFFHVLCYYCKIFVPKKGTLAVLGFHPATKEQREFFSNELKKSGYNLDLEKKQLTDQPELTKFEQSLKHIIEEALDDGDTHNLKADAELLLSVANQGRTKIELTKEEEDAIDQAIISLNDMFDDSQPETCYAGHHVPFDVAAKCLGSLKDKILNSK